MMKSVAFMKKIKLFLLVPTLLSCSFGGEQNFDMSEEKEKRISLLSDPSFENGFNLLTTSTENGRNLAGVLDYGGEAKAAPCFEMAQWWTPFDFIDSAFSKNGEGIYHYENESRALDVNTVEGSLRMVLDSNAEYQKKFGRTRDGSESWSHFLIEQNFKNPAKLGDLEHIYVHLDLVIDESSDKDIGQAVPCSQMTWYFTITNVANGDAAYESGDNDFFWFGLPLFDSRYDFPPGYRHVDSGFVGATNKLIYNLDNASFMKKKLEIGRKVTIDMDILPGIKEAFLYGLERGAMPGSKFNDLVINYMNLGWELPGAFKVDSTFSNLKVEVVLKGGKQ